MNAETALPLERPRRLYLDWVLPVLFKPRAAFAQIVGAGRSTWLTPILLLTLTGLLVVLAAGPIKTAAAQSGIIELPPGSEWWTPEQQAAYMQAQQATSGPVFIYVFPAIIAVLQVWVGWLILAGLLYLVLTVFGGRDASGSTLNLVAWASLPFMLRDLVRAAAMFATSELINRPGLSGFAPSGQGWTFALANELLSRIDIYGLWFVVLLVFAVRAGNGLARGKAITAVLVTVLIVLLLQAAPGVILSQLTGLQIIRPFFF